MCSVWPIGLRPFIVRISHTLPERVSKSQSAGFSSGRELAVHWVRGLGPSISSILLDESPWASDLETPEASYIKKGPCQLSASCYPRNVFSRSKSLCSFLVSPNTKRENRREGLLTCVPLLLLPAPSGQGNT